MSLERVAKKIDKKLSGTTNILKLGGNYMHCVRQIGHFTIFVPILLILLIGCDDIPDNRVETFDISDTDPVSLCTESSVVRSEKEGEISIDCDMKPISAQYLLDTPVPGTVFAKIKCQCEDTASGNIACRRCTCQADAVSNCDSFLVACTRTGGEALGAGDIGICNK